METGNEGRRRKGVERKDGDSIALVWWRVSRVLTFTRERKAEEEGSNRKKQSAEGEGGPEETTGIVGKEMAGARVV